MFDSSCIFCKIIQGIIPAKPVIENDFVFVVPDINPKAPIHYLVMPKKHIIDFAHITDLDHRHMLEMVKMISELGKNLQDPKAFNVISNNGKAAGQSVFHLHWHFIAGKNLYSEGGLAL